MRMHSKLECDGEKFLYHGCTNFYNLDATRFRIWALCECIVKGVDSMTRVGRRSDIRLGSVGDVSGANGRDACGDVCRGA